MKFITFGFLYLIFGIVSNISAYSYNYDIKADSIDDDFIMTRQYNLNELNQLCDYRRIVGLCYNDSIFKSNLTKCKSLKDLNTIFGNFLVGVQGGESDFNILVTDGINRIEYVDYDWHFTGVIIKNSGCQWNNMLRVGQSINNLIPFILFSSRKKVPYESLREIDIIRIQQDSIVEDGENIIFWNKRYIGPDSGEVAYIQILISETGLIEAIYVRTESFDLKEFINGGKLTETSQGYPEWYIDNPLHLYQPIPSFN